mgnify:FL=1|tara:strand:- start:176 stop:550 length:375 start_codon:yes stop_codon:yes gene_type:complete
MGFIWNIIRALTMTEEDYVSVRLEENLRDKYENDSEFRESTDLIFGDNYGKVKYNDSGDIMCKYESGIWGNCKGLGTIEAYAPVGEPIIVCSNCYSNVESVTEIWRKSYSDRKVNPNGPPRLKY